MLYVLMKTREGKDATPAKKNKRGVVGKVARERWMSTVHALCGCSNTFDLELVCLSIFFDHCITPKINYKAINYSLKFITT